MIGNLEIILQASDQAQGRDMSPSAGWRFPRQLVGTLFLGLLWCGDLFHAAPNPGADADLAREYTRKMTLIRKASLFRDGD